MRVVRSQRVTVQTEDFNQWAHESLVELTHHDFGYTDEALADLDADDWEALFQELKERAEAEVKADVESFFQRVAKVSKVENIATRSIKPTSSPASKRTRRG